MDPQLTQNPVFDALAWIKEKAHQIGILDLHEAKLYKLWFDIVALYQYRTAAEGALHDSTTLFNGCVESILLHHKNKSCASPSIPISPSLPTPPPAAQPQPVPAASHTPTTNTPSNNSKKVTSPVLNDLINKNKVILDAIQTALPTDFPSLCLKLQNFLKRRADWEVVNDAGVMGCLKMIRGLAARPGFDLMSGCQVFSTVMCVLDSENGKSLLSASGRRDTVRKWNDDLFRELKLRYGTGARPQSAIPASTLTSVDTIDEGNRLKGTRSGTPMAGVSSTRLNSDAQQNVRGAGAHPITYTHSSAPHSSSVQGLTTFTVQPQAKPQPSANQGRQPPQDIARKNIPPNGILTPVANQQAHSQQLATHGQQPHEQQGPPTLQGSAPRQATLTTPASSTAKQLTFQKTFHNGTVIRSDVSPSIPIQPPANMNPLPTFGNPAPTPFTPIPASAAAARTAETHQSALPRALPIQQQNKPNSTQTTQRTQPQQTAQRSEEAAVAPSQQAQQFLQRPSAATSVQMTPSQQAQSSSQRPPAATSVQTTPSQQTQTSAQRTLAATSVQTTPSQQAQSSAQRPPAATSVSTPPSQQAQSSTQRPPTATSVPTPPSQQAQQSLQRPLAATSGQIPPKPKSPLSFAYNFLRFAVPPRRLIKPSSSYGKGSSGGQTPNKILVYYDAEGQASANWEVATYSHFKKKDRSERASLGDTWRTKELRWRLKVDDEFNLTEDEVRRVARSSTGAIESPLTIIATVRKVDQTTPAGSLERNFPIDERGADWPQDAAADLRIYLNNHIVPIQRRVTVSMPSQQSYTVQGKDLSCDLGRFVKKGKNALRVQWRGVWATHLFAVMIFEGQSTETAVEKARNSLITKEDSISLAHRLLGIKDSREKKRDDDEIVCLTTSFRLSLRCPLSLARIAEPARGRRCKHLSCFDLSTYMDLNQRQPTWICPHCGDRVSPKDLAIDSFVQEVLQMTADRADDTREVDVFEGGQWEETVKSEENGFSIPNLDGEDAEEVDEDAEDGKSKTKQKFLPMKRNDQESRDTLAGNRKRESEEYEDVQDEFGRSVRRRKLNRAGTWAPSTPKSTSSSRQSSSAPKPVVIVLDSDSDG